MKYLLTLLPLFTYSQDIVIKKDTTVNNVWDLSGRNIRFESGGKISGKGTLRNGFIDARLSQQIFDSSIVLTNMDVYGYRFSCAWYGAKPSNADNWWNIQKTINTCITYGIRECFLPKGVYSISKSLTIKNIYKEQYVGVPLHFFGESSMWYDGSVINYTASTGFALGIQVGKGAEINNLTLRGKFRAPTTTGVEYYTTPFEKFGPEGLFGLIIDYDNSKNQGGSTAIKVHDMIVSGFTVLYSVSPNGYTYNADILSFENIQCGEGRVGFSTGQAQEKGNTVRNITSWGKIHTLISIGRAGKAQAGNYTFDGGNIAGGCIRLFDINQQGWYTSSISNFFAESLWSIGNLNTGDSKNLPPLPIRNSTFHFAILGQDRNLLTSNSTAVKFDDCIFRYYGSQEVMSFNGVAMYSECFFSGTIKNPTIGSVFLKAGKLLTTSPVTPLSE
jgi:hypothetical protein